MIFEVFEKIDPSKLFFDVMKSQISRASAV